MKTLRGRLHVGGKLQAGTLAWEAGRIASIDVEGEIGGADLPIVAAGLVDLHVHGFGGCDPTEDLPGMALALARSGTTAFQPTLFPSAPERLGAQCEDLWSRAQKLPRGAGARVLGLHLEGPFLHPEAAGALSVADLSEPSRGALRSILGPAGGDGRGVRTMTLAPELRGAPDLIEELVRSGVRVSLGHSCASAAEARAAARAGASGATHLYNAMRPLHHREPGLLGFALTDGALHAEIIGDLVHVGPEAIELALRARGAEGLCLVSDALRGAGTGCDRFLSHGREHVVRNGAAYRAPEQKLAGSASSQLEMIRRLTSSGVLGLAEALSMASATPAQALGVAGEIGALRAGLAADFLVLRGPGLALEQVWVAGDRLL